MIDVSKLPPKQLFELHSTIEDELLRKKVICTRNNPTGDLAEHLFREAFPSWKPAEKSQRFDAIGPAPGKLRYQIKGRRIIGKGSRQLSAIRDLKDNYFDSLAGVLFNEDYSVYRALIIPHAVIVSLKSHLTYQKHTRSHLFHLVESIWEIPGVRDVTAKLQSVWH
jgi:hypothetical protein